MSIAGDERARARAAFARAKFEENLALLERMAACGEQVSDQIESTKQSMEKAAALEGETDADKSELLADRAVAQLGLLYDWQKRVLSDELDKRLGPVLNEHAALKVLFEHLRRVQSARMMLLTKVLNETNLPVKPDDVWQVLANSKMISTTIDELEIKLRALIRNALRPEFDFKTSLAHLEELSCYVRSCIQTETTQLHEEMRNSETVRAKFQETVSLFSSPWSIMKPTSAFQTSEDGSAFQDNRKRPRVVSEASSVDEEPQDRFNATQTSLQSVPFEGERNESPSIVPQFQYVSAPDPPIGHRGDYYIPTASITRGFVTTVNPESNARVHITTCSCTFDEGGNEVPFQWMFFVYRSPYYRELTFEFSPTQVLSVVLPQRLIVVDSACECISKITSTVAALKSKKKGFFRALTGLGYAHKVMAKRDKKFQNQAWTATVAGVKQWLNRVRSFSPNALMIEDADIMRLEEFIDTRVAPIIDLWENSAICA